MEYSKILTEGKMGNLQTVNSSVPANIQDIANEVLIGRDRLDAIRAALRATKKVNKPTYDAMKAEGREYGERILDYELKLSEYFNSLSKGSGGNRGNQHTGGKIDTGVDFAKHSKMQIIKDMGFEQKDAERIQLLTPEAVEQAKAEARENNDIPTRSLALHIAKQNVKDYKPQKQDKPRTWNYVYQSRASFANENEKVINAFEDLNKMKNDGDRVDCMRNSIDYMTDCIKAYKRAIIEMGYELKE